MCGGQAGSRKLAGLTPTLYCALVSYTRAVLCVPGGTLAGSIPYIRQTTYRNLQILPAASCSIRPQQALNVSQDECPSFVPCAFSGGGLLIRNMPHLANQITASCGSNVFSSLYFDYTLGRSMRRTMRSGRKSRAHTVDSMRITSGSDTWRITASCIVNGTSSCLSAPHSRTGNSQQTA